MTNSHSFRVAVAEHLHPVGKRLTIDGHKIKKETLPRRLPARARTLTFAGLPAYTEWLRRTDARALQFCGLWDDSSDGRPLAYSGDEGEAGTSATNAHLAFRPGPALLRIDTDYKQTSDVVALWPDPVRRFATHAEWIETLRAVVPELAGVGLVVADSSSSNVHAADGTPLTGRRGLHTLIPVDDGAQIPRLLDVMFRRFWAAGHGWAFICGGGGLLLRSPIDMVTARPHQPAFAVPVVVGGTSRREITLIDGAMLRAAHVPDLTADEQAAHREHVRRATAALGSARHKERSRRTAEVAEELTRNGVGADEARRQATAFVSGGALPLDALITFANGDVLAARELLKIGASRDGQNCLDPLEPGYRGGEPVGRFYWNDGREPRIYSFAHGGRTFSFATDPEDSAIKALHLMTDQRNTERLQRAAGEDLMTVGGRWLAWSGKHWADAAGSVARTVMRLSALIREEADEFDERAKAAKSQDEAKALVALAADLRRWGLQSEMRGRLEAAEALLAKVSAVAPDDVDADPWLLNVANGTIDLRTGRLRDHRRRDRITRLIDVEYFSGAPAPRWERFLREIMGEEGAEATPLTDFLRRWFGYCATGSVREEALAVLWGDGGNGKSRLLAAIESVLGGYAGAAAPHLLELGAERRHETELADLRGRRLVTASELSEGSELQENLVKRLTGGDRIKARHMRQDHFEFAPTHKLCVLTNHRPVIRGQDRGIWRRVMLVPFCVTFGTAEEVAAGKAQHVKETSLGEALRAERPGILAWLVRGAREWFEEGLRPPDAVLQATKDYRREQDRVGEFLAECCAIGRQLKVPLRDVKVLGFTKHRGIYSVYSEWSRECGYRPLGLGRFKDAVAGAVPGFITEEGKLSVGDDARRSVTFAVGVALR
jgi:P4 family phage/plasmid primase-like protien